MRTFEVIPGVVPSWPGMAGSAEVVARFLGLVRTTGDPAAAELLMATSVSCHQVNSEAPETIERTPAEYAEHVRDMLTAFGRFRYTVTELLSEEDRVYVRWRQDGHDVAVSGPSPATGAPLSDFGSAVYRVADGRIAEYWIQLDRLGLARQIESAGDWEEEQATAGR